MIMFLPCYPVELAVKHNTASVVEKIFNNSHFNLQPVYFHHEYLGTPITHLAVETGNLHVVRAVMAYFSGNQRSFLSIFDCEKNQNVMHLAMRKNSDEIFDELLSYDRGNTGTILLHITDNSRAKASLKLTYTNL